MDARELVDGLSDPAAFPRAGDRVEVVETHVSLVFLTGDRVYKLKKTISLWGFLDYSTIEKRRFYCEEEVRLNRRLAPGVYLGVEPVVRRDGRFAVGGRGDLVDWAVVMRRLADEDTLAHRVGAGIAGADELAFVARRIARFHDGADRGPRVAAVATPLAFARILQRNVRSTRGAVPAVFPRALHALVERRFATWFRTLRATLERRRHEGRMVEGHGDLRAEHVVRFAGRGGIGLVVIDGVEFSEALRSIDPLSDAAFLATDLASLGRRDLGDAFLTAYLSARPDPDADALLPFYLAYRAHVRANVDAIRARPGTARDDMPAVARERALAGAHRHLALAWSWARTGASPLVLLAGPSGTGKSAVARAVAPLLGADVFSSDVERKRLAGLGPTERASGASLARLYSPSMSIRTYAALVASARRSLAAGRPVILDATFLRRSSRTTAIAAARRLGCPTAIVSISVPEVAARERIESRARANADPSDASFEVYQSQVESADRVRSDEADVVVEHDGLAPPDALLMPLLEGLAAKCAMVYA